MLIGMGEIIREQRRRAGVRQEDLASALGITCQAVSRWETGLSYPDLELIPAIADYFGIGIGPGFGYEKNTVAGGSDWTHSLVISPRAGVELFERVRMSVQYQWYLNSGGKYSNVAFGLSWCFGPGMGGGRRPYRR